MKKLSLAFGFRTSGGTSQVPGR